MKGHAPFVFSFPFVSSVRVATMLLATASNIVIAMAIKKVLREQNFFLKLFVKRCVPRANPCQLQPHLLQLDVPHMVLPIGFGQGQNMLADVRGVGGVCKAEAFFFAGGF